MLAVTLEGSHSLQNGNRSANPLNQISTMEMAHFDSHSNPQILPAKHALSVGLIFRLLFQAN